MLLEVPDVVQGTDGGLRLAGVLGRVGAAVKVRGMFVHPHQARHVVATLTGHGAAAARFVVDREGERDLLRLELVAAAHADTAALGEVAERVTREALRVRPDVVLVDSLDDDAVLVDARDWA